MTSRHDFLAVLTETGGFVNLLRNKPSLQHITVHHFGNHHIILQRKIF